MVQIRLDRANRVTFEKSYIRNGGSGRSENSRKFPIATVLEPDTGPTYSGLSGCSKTDHRHGKESIQNPIDNST